eukprot:6465842-Amphidinium_carterae.1
MCAIADDNRLLRAHLHVGLLQRFEHIPVAVPQVVSKVRSGSNQDHVVNVLSHLDLPTRTLQGADQEGVEQINS